MIKTLRKKMFWSMDSLKGGNLRKHYEDLNFILNNPLSAEAEKVRALRLEKILDHAAISTPFYKKFKGCTLDGFEVINKNTIRNSYEDFKSSKFLGKKNYSAYTSGSTGTPFKLLHNRNKRLRNSADVIYFAQQTGFEIGDKLYYIRHWDQYNSSHPIITRMKNIYKHPVSKLSHMDIDGLLKDMANDPSRKGIMCYASVLDEVSKYLENNPNPPQIDNIKSIIAISESLKEDVQLRTSAYFNSAVVSRYSNVENGIFAQQFLDSPEFQINWASYQIEILDLKKDIAVADGQLGRIVITDLYNYCMPMIRYDTGDIGAMKIITKNGKKIKVLERIEGRKLDMIYNTEGTLMSPFTVYHILKYPHIIQYQFIQEDKTEYRIKLNVSKEFNSAEKIVEEFKQYLGLDALIKIEYVDDIPLISSGKRKFVLNTMSSI